MNDESFGKASHLIIENVVVGGMTCLWLGIFLLRVSGLCPAQFFGHYVPSEGGWLMVFALVGSFYVIGSLVNDFTSNFPIFNKKDEKLRSEVMKYKVKLKEGQVIEDPKEVSHLMRFYIYNKSPQIKGHLDYLRRLIRLNRNSILNFLALSVFLTPWGPNPLFANNRAVGISVWILTIGLFFVARYVWKNQQRRFYEAIARAYRSLREIQD